MVAKRRGLGRHLDALLSVHPQSMTSPVAPEPLFSSFLMKELPLSALQSSRYQPRQAFDQAGLEELALSIKAQGILQPIVVRQGNDTHQYDIIAGERRWRAAKLAGLETVPVLIKEVSDQVAMALALIENIQRENLNPVEEAFAIQRLLDECALTHQAVADALGKSRVAITHLLRILTLQEDVKQYLANGDIDLGHAKVLMGLSKPQQLIHAKIIIEKGLSVRQTEALIQQSQRKQIVTTAKQAEPNIDDLLRMISEKLCAKVDIQTGKKGSGKLVIYYNDLNELDGILEHIQ
jgi:ParB family transcriptional regulator, chromosome partitioning protein